MTRRRARQKREPFKDERPDALELMARLLVGGSYREPVAGTGTKAGLQATDIAGAAGYMTGTLGREIALAVATRASDGAIAILATRAYARCARAVRMMRHPRPIKHSDAADRWRLRIIVYDAVIELVYPERRQPFRVLAKAAKMRQADYARLHKVVTAELQELMNNARREFTARLWGAE